MDNPIIYEQPLNERMRTFLRLEHLFNMAAYSLRGFSVWDSRTSLGGMIQILDILSRNDLKNEILKELERLTVSLNALRNLPGVDKQQLQSILSQLENAQQDVHSQTGQFGSSLREDEMIKTLRQRSSITGGDCNFDLPGYHHWLEREPEKRITELEAWFDELDCIQKPVKLILAILRESSDARELLAEAGFYQQSLDPSAPVQILRVLLPRESNVYPEISAGKHRFSIRFLQPLKGTRPVQSEDDIPFSFYSCAL